MLGVADDEAGQDFGAVSTVKRVGGKLLAVEVNPVGISNMQTCSFFLPNANVSIISKICAQRFCFHS